ncbi:hypothetical protein EJC51_46860 [Streptomyces aquilus]|uniref:Uncharacterized protein n=1 Tax=Streptomyces aquilus TaxID=2548456 RepID=A0A3Q9C5X6_9ACTN|nr:hypothetical protein [Streptomyces aquilus]AZP22897.1 hypothetical protein EJC51_46860 [Streptomyces aquilus]
MSGRGRRAALPPTDYRKAPVLDADGLVIRPVSGAGKPLGVWDFRDSPGPVDFRRALVAALAAQGRGWGSQDTYQTNTSTLKLLFKHAAAAEPPVTATEHITVEWWKQWSGDIHVRRVLAAVVRRAPGVPEATRVFMETPRRRPPARRGRRRHASNTLVDVGEGSSGRALRHVLELTAQARTTLEALGRPATKLLVGHRGLGGAENLRDHEVGKALEGAIRLWQQQVRAGGVDLPARVHAQALRHSAQAHHGRARNNTQDTHERDYQLQDEDVRAASRGAVELGLAQALASARQTVAMRLVEEVDAVGEVSPEPVAQEAGIDVEVARRIVAGRLRTPVASCADFLNSDHSTAGMPCAVSFLLCFSCRNAVATGRDLPRIAYLHQALESLRSAVTPAVWAADWATHHARIGDFLTTYTTTDARPQLFAAVADSERELIHAMLERRLDP